MEIPIFFTIDNSFIPFFVVTLKSVMWNASKKYNYHIRVLSTDVTEENQKEVKKMENSNFKIEFVDVTNYIKEIESKLYTRDYYTKTTYFRLFIPDLFPNIDKALYLDSDIIVLGDISELYNIDIGDNLIGAAPDQVIESMEEFQTYAEKVVGVRSYKNYFNAGILIMNLKELRNFEFQRKFRYLLDHVKYIVAQDQDYLNRLCKGRVKLISKDFNVMPIPAKNIDEENMKIIHYNLIYKPWHFDDILFEDYFWTYAQKTPYYDVIKKIKDDYPESQKFEDMKTGENLVKLAEVENECVGDDRAKKQENQQPRAKDRLEIINKIAEYEREGKFDVDTEEDPVTIPLKLEDVDYLDRKIKSKVKTSFANAVAERFLNLLIRHNKLIIKEIIGLENLATIQSGAVITCNHFNPFDVFAVEECLRRTDLKKDKTMYKIIREGNYTNFPGLYGFFFRNCNTLPLSTNNLVMTEFLKSCDIILQRGDLILIYPEQSLWWNYKKPKPLKVGAFRIAARNKVPVVPIFITMEDSDQIEPNGFPTQMYTLHIEKPIYPIEENTEKENALMMKNENYNAWKRVYETAYNTKLTYTTDPSILKKLGISNEE